MVRLTFPGGLEPAPIPVLVSPGRVVAPVLKWPELTPTTQALRSEEGLSDARKGNQVVGGN